MVRGFILERNAICPRLLLLVCFASVSESRLQMKILPDDFISTSVMQPYSFPCVVWALEEGPVILNRQHTEACLTLQAPELLCGLVCPSCTGQLLPIAQGLGMMGWREEL
jgi:hypothetical protein